MDKVYLKYKKREEKEGEEKIEIKPAKQIIEDNYEEPEEEIKDNKKIKKVIFFSAFFVLMLVIIGLFFKDSFTNKPVYLENERVIKGEQVDLEKIKEMELKQKQVVTYNHIEQMIIYDLYITKVYREIVEDTKKYLGFNLNYALYRKNMKKLYQDTNNVVFHQNNLFYDIISERINNLNSLLLKINSSAIKSDKELVEVINTHLRKESNLKKEQNEQLTGLIEKGQLEHTITEDNKIIIIKPSIEN